ncbi:b4400384-6f98-44d9-bbf2-72ecfe979505 [Thermothielavioides terrestris]|uniref:Conserved oligomeric Golgi complex subunit 1 n=1 Tax=Thermothielavioides terrestris TaxID=2587410 RepID=A0A3S4C6T3_9PEZI|nr:b4400384-6f98-44d9-bbf2-72ecfe979505 [Thermothielavioides terrestris]
MAAALLPKDFDLSTLTTSAALFSPSSTPATTTTPGQQSTPAPQPPSSPNHSTAPAPSYTLPQIRAIHGALHARVADLSAALRTRVGASYRELLGTADTIVAMRRDMDDRVLATLGGMGGRCGGGVVGAKVQGLRAFAAGDQYHGEEGRGRGEGLMVAARLYVLGRLLVQSFGEGAGGAGGMEKKVAAARKSLETVHQARLARSIDAVLRSGSHKAMRQGDVLRALGAYSLATSSGARDVLAHFLRVRAKAIAMALHVDEEDEEDRVVRNPQDVLRALGLYTKTLQDVQALVPHELTEALVALKEERLLENASLKEMEGLRLDIYRRWCGDEIQFYTPFIRHDDLDGKQAREMLASWAEKGSEVLLQGLEKTLEGMAEFKAVVDLRTSVLKLWIAEGGKARGFDPSIMLNQLRDVINKHMLRVLEAKVAKLRLVGSEVSATLDAWREGVTDRHPSLWDVASFDTDLSNGSTLFTQDVVARLHGRNDAVSRAVTSFKSWFHVIDDVGQVVDQLRRQRWDNDVDEIEDEETIEERQKLLSKDDPRALSEHLNRLLVEAFRRLDDQLTTLWKVQQGGPNNGVVAMYFLRLLRDMRARLPELEAVKGFGLSAVPSLHEAVAAVVVLQPLDELASVALARKTVVGRSLWEGDPELPSSPSPGAFKFLRNLTVAMGDAGGDLWSPAAVAVLKRHLTKQISAAWLEALGALGGPQDGENKNAEGAQTEEEGSKEEGTSVNATASTGHQDLLIQWLLDIYYLGLFLGSDEDSFKELEEAVYPRSGLEPSAKERLNKAARDYFKRTRLLFGLLA